MHTIFTTEDDAEFPSLFPMEVHRCTQGYARLPESQE